MAASSRHRATAIGINARMRTLLIAILAATLAAPVAARMPPASIQQHEPAPARALAGQMSLDDAVAMVQARHKARVMRANTVEENGRVVHYIRLMTADGSRVWTVRVDAATGREF